MIRFLFLLLVLLLPNPSFAGGFSSPNVPVDDPVYRQIDKLIAFGLIKDAIYGQRPWSRNEIARMIGEAMKNREKVGPPLAPDDREISSNIAVDDLLEGLKRDYKEELIRRGILEGETKKFYVHPLEQVSFDYTALDSPPRDIPVSNGSGLIDGFINPLVAQREGLDFVDGNNLSLETSHSASLTKYFSLHFRPHARLLVPNTGETKAKFIVQDLYGKFNIRNFEIEAGRDHLIWGHAENGGLIFSNNARSLDMIKISNDSPFYHPWIFRYFGPSKYTFFIANLGPERIFKNSFLYGFKVTIKPTHFLELGLSETIVIGGDGAPSLSFFDPIGELFPVHKIGRNILFDDKSDHRFGFFDMRLTIPPLRNSVLYFDSFFDDSPARAFGHLGDLMDQMAMMVGFYIPRLTTDGSADLTLEYRHVPGVGYRHSNWTTGYTLNREIIGDPLGPDADSILLKFSADLSDNKILTTSLSYENRDSDTFSQTTNPVTGGGEEIIRATDNPTEHRIRFLASLDWRAKPWLVLRPEIGYERVVNFNFIPRNDRNNFLGGIALTFSPLDCILGRTGFPHEP